MPKVGNLINTLYVNLTFPSIAMQRTGWRLGTLGKLCNDSISMALSGHQSVRDIFMSLIGLNVSP